jgi:hypothetical protein
VINLEINKVIHKISVQLDSKFKIEGVAFKVYQDGRGVSLWVDGGTADDLLIKNLPQVNNSDEAEIEVTEAEVSKARVYLRHLAD